MATSRGPKPERDHQGDVLNWDACLLANLCVILVMDEVFASARGNNRQQMAHLQHKKSRLHRKLHATTKLARKIHEGG